MTTPTADVETFIKSKIENIKPSLGDIVRGSQGLFEGFSIEYETSGISPSVKVVFDAPEANFNTTEHKRIKGETITEVLEEANRQHTLFFLGAVSHGRSGARKLIIPLTFNPDHVRDVIEKGLSSAYAVKPDRPPRDDTDPAMEGDIPAPSERFGLKTRSVYSGLTDISISKSDLKSVLGKVQQGLDAPISETEFRRYIRENPNLKRLVQRSAEQKLVSATTIDQMKEALNELNDVARAQVEEGVAFKPKKPVPVDRKVYATPRRFKPLGL